MVLLDFPTTILLMVSLFVLIPHIDRFSCSDKVYREFIGLLEKNSSCYVNLNLSNLSLKSNICILFGVVMSVDIDKILGGTVHLYFMSFRTLVCM